MSFLGCVAGWVSLHLGVGGLLHCLLGFVPSGSHVVAQLQGEGEPWVPITVGETLVNTAGAGRVLVSAGGAGGAAFSGGPQCAGCGVCVHWHFPPSFPISPWPGPADPPLCLCALSLPLPCAQPSFLGVDAASHRAHCHRQLGPAGSLLQGRDAETPLPALLLAPFSPDSPLPPPGRRTHTGVEVPPPSLPAVGP